MCQDRHGGGGGGARASRTVAEVFAEDECQRLLALPQHRLDTSDRCTASSGKTPWVRFDRNDYSIPPGAVGKQLTLIATDTEIRLLDGVTEIAAHPRCFGQRQRVTDPVHSQALLAQKRGAAAGAIDSALRLAVPEMAAFLDAAFPRYRSTALLTAPLTRLLGLYGPEALRAAVSEALARGTATVASVEYLLEKHRRETQRRPPLPVDLSNRPELAAFHVRPHSLAGTFKPITDFDWNWPKRIDRPLLERAIALDFLREGGGRLQTESVVAFERNGWSPSTGIRSLSTGTCLILDLTIGFLRIHMVGNSERRRNKERGAPHAGQTCAQAGECCCVARG